MESINFSDVIILQLLRSLMKNIVNCDGNATSSYYVSFKIVGNDFGKRVSKLYKTWIFRMNLVVLFQQYKF